MKKLKIEKKKQITLSQSKKIKTKVFNLLFSNTDCRKTRKLWLPRRSGQGRK